MLNFVTRRSLLVFLVALACPLFVSRARADFALRSGDRVVFYGDSITDQRLYTTFVETFVLTRFPDLEVSFVHSGWGGDRVGGGGGGPIDLRLQRDVLAHDPTVVTIMLGMNDASYRAFDEAIFETYANGYRHILNTLAAAKPGLRVTLIQPSPFDDVTRPPSVEGGYNAVLLRYGGFVNELAAERGLGAADLNTGVVAALQKAEAANPEMAERIIPDRVHPGPAGHLLMAGELLKAWQAPATVTAVDIDARGMRVVEARNTKVSEFNATNGLSWTQLDKALPMPLDLADPVIKLAVESSDFMETLNQQPLRITGLAPGRYALSIDGEPACEASAEEWAAGINLATLPTPMAKQAMEVHRLTVQHNNVHFLRWRSVQVPLSGRSQAVQDALPPLLKALDEEEQAIVEQQRAAARPVARRYELRAAEGA